jgi:hypothetical protein
MQPSTEAFHDERNQPRIAVEAALDGLYILRTSVPAAALDTASTVCAYKTPISAERNSATNWKETAQCLPRKSDDLRRQGRAVYRAKRVVEQGVLSNPTTAGARLTPSVSRRLVRLWLLGALGIYVAHAPLNTGKIDQPYGGLTHG